MKRCPECGREYDGSMMFCLDDGAELLYGPASFEPSTVIIAAASATEPETQILLPKTDTRTTYLSVNVRSNRRSVMTAIIGAVLVTALALGSYWLYGRGSSKQIESVAVMPFVNDSGNPDLEFLSDGMTETLIRSLSQLPNLNVKARSSVFRYKGKDADPRTVASELGVQAILNGRVRGHGDQIILDLELFDPVSQNVIWTNEYDRKQSDLVALQRDIAVDVLDRLRTKLSGAEKGVVSRTITPDSAAYQSYLKGRYHWAKRTPDDLQKAIEHFKSAIDADQNFALAYTGLADTYSVMQYYIGSRSGDFVQQAGPYANKAVELDDQLAEAHSSRAFVNEGSWKWSDAEREYERALQLNPGYSSGLLRYSRFEYRVPKRDGQALTRMKRALDSEPSSLVVNDNLSQMYLAQGSVDLALAQAKRTVELDPNYSFGWIDLAYAQLKKGQNAEALASAERVAEVGKRSSRTLVCYGFVNAVTGKRSEAVAILKELETRYEANEADATDVAAVHAGLGNEDEAFAWLDRAFTDHSSLLVDLRAEYPFGSLLDDPRYEDLRKRMNLPE